MSQSIWKYELPLVERSSVRVPKGARVLSLGVQAGTPTLWMLVDPNEQQELREFRLAGTGHRIDLEGLTFIGTFQLELARGEFVGHVFEVRNCTAAETPERRI